MEKTDKNPTVLMGNVLLGKKTYQVFVKESYISIVRSDDGRPQTSERVPRVLQLQSIETGKSMLIMDPGIIASLERQLTGDL